MSYYNQQQGYQPQQQNPGYGWNVGGGQQQQQGFAPMPPPPGECLNFAPLFRVQVSPSCVCEVSEQIRNNGALEKVT